MRKQQTKTTNALCVVIIALMLLFGGGFVRSEEQEMLIVSYNVENLFDTINDPQTEDDDFTPEGLYHWTASRYHKKLQRIAQVVCNIGGAATPAIVGLVEVETEACLKDLCRWYLPRRHFPYGTIHFDGPDRRGIDVGLLYDSTRLVLEEARPLPVSLPEGDRPTRDILYCRFCEAGDSLNMLHLMLCHFPSQRGGAKQTAYRREAAERVLQQQTDSILATDSTAIIVAMGDFNSPGVGPGTHKYQGGWSALDQFRLSKMAEKKASQSGVYAPDWLLENDSRFGESQPFRTYIGPRYHNGYSDHLPIFLYLK